MENHVINTKILTKEEQKSTSLNLQLPTSQFDGGYTLSDICLQAVITKRELPVLSHAQMQQAWPRKL